MGRNELTHMLDTRQLRASSGWHRPKESPSKCWSERQQWTQSARHTLSFFYRVVGWQSANCNSTCDTASYCVCPRDKHSFMRKRRLMVIAKRNIVFVETSGVTDDIQCTSTYTQRYVISMAIFLVSLFLFPSGTVAQHFRPLVAGARTLFPPLAPFRLRTTKKTHSPSKKFPKCESEARWKAKMLQMPCLCFAVQSIVWRTATGARLCDIPKYRSGAKIFNGYDFSQSNCFSKAQNSSWNLFHGISAIYHAQRFLSRPSRHVAIPYAR